MTPERGEVSSPFHRVQKVIPGLVPLIESVLAERRGLSFSELVDDSRQYKPGGYTCWTLVRKDEARRIAGAQFNGLPYAGMESYVAGIWSPDQIRSHQIASGRQFLDRIARRYRTDWNARRSIEATIFEGQFLARGLWEMHDESMGEIAKLKIIPSQTNNKDLIIANKTYKDGIEERVKHIDPVFYRYQPGQALIIDQPEPVSSVSSRDLGAVRSREEESYWAYQRCFVTVVPIVQTLIRLLPQQNL